MSKHHRLGDANTDSGFYNYWMRQLTSMKLTIRNSIWYNTITNVSQKRNVIEFRTGTLNTHKLARLYGRATSSSCLLSHQPDSQLQMLSGSYASNQNMVTDRHNIASRPIIKNLEQRCIRKRHRFHRHCTHSRTHTQTYAHTYAHIVTLKRAHTRKHMHTHTHT